MRCLVLSFNQPPARHRCRVAAECCILVKCSSTIFVDRSLGCMATMRFVVEIVHALFQGFALVGCRFFLSDNAEHVYLVADGPEATPCLNGQPVTGTCCLRHVCAQGFRPSCFLPPQLCLCLRKSFHSQGADDLCGPECSYTCLYRFCMFGGCLHTSDACVLQGDRVLLDDNHVFVVSNLHQAEPSQAESMYEPCRCPNPPAPACTPCCLGLWMCAA